MPATDNSELDGMPPSMPIIRVNGDRFVDALPNLELEAEATVTAKVVVKRLGSEAVGGKRREFMQLYASDIKVKT